MQRANSSVAKGAIGESIAVHYLIRHGYEVIERNFNCRGGEVDIIAMRRGSLCFIEVKAWRSLRYGDIGDSVGRRKQRRIIQGARYFLQKYVQFAEYVLCFAVLFVDMYYVECRYIESAFEEEHEWREQRGR